MRLLLFSDLHLDAPLTKMSKDDMRAAFQRVCELARSLQVDALCGAGNLFDNGNTAADTAEVLQNGFAGINPIPVFLAPGSSDHLVPGSLYSQTAWSPNVHVFTEAHLRGLTIATGFTLWGAAHVRPVHPVGFLGTGEPTNAGRNVALFHGCERSEYANQNTMGQITAPFHGHEVRGSGFNHALVGHLPMPRATAEYTYAGAPAPHEPTGAPRGGAVLVTVHNDGSVEQEWYDLFAHAAFVRITPPDGASSNGGQQTDFEKAPGVLAAATAATTATPAAAREEPLVAPDFPESTVRGQFVRSVLRSEFGRDDRKRILTMGLAALNGQTDFGEL